MASDLEEVNRRLKKIMLQAYDSVENMAKEKSSTLRMGAYMLALDRLCTASRLRGGPISMS